MTDARDTDRGRTEQVCYRASSTTHTAVLDDEVLIWDAGRVQLHRLNASAARVWSELSRWRSPSDVAEALAEVLPVDERDLRRDVDSCISGLLRAGLVERSVAGESP